MNYFYNNIKTNFTTYSCQEQKNIKISLSLSKKINKKNNTLSKFHKTILCSIILSNLNSDATSILATILYSIIKHTHIHTTFKNLIINKNTIKLIKQLNILNINKIMFHKNMTLKNTNALLTIMFENTNDIRILLIKLSFHIADIIYYKKNQHKKIKHIMLSKKLYIPLTNRLRIKHIKKNLENIAFKFQEPYKYKKLNTYLTKIKLKNLYYIKTITTITKLILNKHVKEIKYNIRTKHIYSIWLKMQKNLKKFYNILDTSAIRLITTNINNCYKILGLIHSKFTFVHKNFNDYIINPKKNMYQSLHTIIHNKNFIKIEIQIRTNYMNEQSKIGSISHWIYKEKFDHIKKENALFYCKTIKLTYNIKNISLRFSTKKIYDNKLYTFTTQGDTIILPHKATILDFSYKIHSELKNKHKHIKENNKIISTQKISSNGKLINLHN